LCLIESEHDAECRDDAVEGAVAKRQALGIGLPKADRRSNVGGELARRRQQLLGDVHARYGCTGAGHIAGGPAGSSCNVQDGFACACVEPLGRVRQRVRDGEAHVVVVPAAATPHGRSRLVMSKNSVIGCHVRGLGPEPRQPADRSTPPD
jgi:hypothetical protein